MHWAEDELTLRRICVSSVRRLFRYLEKLGIAASKVRARRQNPKSVTPKANLSHPSRIATETRTVLQVTVRDKRANKIVSFFSDSPFIIQFVIEEK